MSALANCTSIAVYLAHEASTAHPERALEMLKALNSRLASKGLTLEGVVDDALSPHHRFGRMPNDKLSNKTWRAWAVYLLSLRDKLPLKDVTHLRYCYEQKSYLKKAQIRWIHDIVFREEPAACGTWGARG